MGYQDKKQMAKITLSDFDQEFLKIGVHQNFQGQGVFRRALGLLARKHGITQLYSTIAIANKKSAIAHEKLGFRRVRQREEDELKGKGLLLKRNMRYVKVF
jgi:RimJ/RimL family protein N-acetyltransferase